ncbi:MAG TPA: hypothetical protein VM935_16900 [Chitinophagaceae bacterium]|nr:hypothetical protein [Chitinophagaceae bacterium]
MKQVLLIFLSIIQLSCFAQFDKPVTIRATTNFNIALKGLATNDAGIGVGIDASFFSTHKLQVLLETSADWFFGDKLLIIDASTGEKVKSAAVHSLRLGPQFFIHKNLALSITYGPAWSVVQDTDYSLHGGLKYGATGFLGKKRNVIAKLFMVNIPAAEQTIHYLGLAGGFRF